MAVTLEYILQDITTEIPVVLKRYYEEAECCIRGFHFYKESWQPKEGDILLHEKYAIALKNKNGLTVGHVPKLMTKHCYFFLKYNGKIRANVNGAIRYCRDLIQGDVFAPLQPDDFAWYA